MGVDLFVCCYCIEAFTEYDREYCILEENFDESKYSHLNKNKYEYCCGKNVMCYNCHYEHAGLCPYHIKLFEENNIEIYDLEKEENGM